MQFISMRLMRAFIFVLMTIFVANSVYAGTMMTAAKTAVDAHAHHEVAMHMDGMMHDTQMPHHDTDQHHSGYCHDCLACLNMLPVDISTHTPVIPDALSIVMHDVLYSSPATPTLQRPPISILSA
ncbi:hypothetical protein [Methylovorus sp. MM2]|uniref:hypothetical protein n=1 Tax=Methylovorus sp. MM2 TaxID=1848038 RepID=UPI0010420F38|nr:hypothetical protein [Methylovorus sp. MM2]